MSGEAEVGVAKLAGASVEEALDAILACSTPREAGDCLKLFLVLNPLADENVGYVLGLMVGLFLLRKSDKKVGVTL